MSLPLQIAFHNLPRSPIAEARIREQFAQLTACYGRITSGRAVVDVPHRHRREGNAVQIRLDFRLPGAELVVKRTGAGPELEPTLADAFDDARRQLDDLCDRRRRRHRSQSPTPRAQIIRIFPEENDGYLATPDGREVYFHAKDVRQRGGIARLEIGCPVRFVERDGELGSHAVAVRPVGRPAQAGAM